MYVDDLLHIAACGELGEKICINSWPLDTMSRRIAVEFSTETECIHLLDTGYASVDETERS